MVLCTHRHTEKFYHNMRRFIMWKGFNGKYYKLIHNKFKTFYTSCFSPGSRESIIILDALARLIITEHLLLSWNIIIKLREFFAGKICDLASHKNNTKRTLHDRSFQYRRSNSQGSTMQSSLIQVQNFTQNFLSLYMCENLRNFHSMIRNRYEV